jgi:hypothetical protein
MSLTLAQNSRPDGTLQISVQGAAQALRLVPSSIFDRRRVVAFRLGVISGLG